MGCNFVLRLAINEKIFVGYRRLLDLKSYDLVREVKVLFLSENTKTLTKTNFWFVIKVHTRLKGRGEAFRMYSYKVFVKEISPHEMYYCTFAYTLGFPFRYENGVFPFKRKILV